jgi:type I protein arginine methyltransferase
MGYALLFESMLESVLLCRDRWLKPGGAMIPDMAIIHVAAGSAAATGLDFWDDIYGFKFPDIKEASRKSTLTQPLISPVNQSTLLSTSAAIKEFDLTSMSKDDVDFHSEFELAIEQAGDCHAFVMWFDTPFSSRFCQEAPCVLSTSPAGTATHWAQTVFVLEHVLHVAPGEKLRCRCSFARSDKHRSIDISLEVQHVGVDGKDGGKQAQVFVMAVASKDSGVEEVGSKVA